MKRLPFVLTLSAVLAAVSPCGADGELRALQDSVGRWLAAHPDDLLAEAFTTAWSDEANGRVEVYLLRADSAMKARFRRCMHDGRWNGCPTAACDLSRTGEENGAAEHRFTARLHPRLFPVAFGRYRICKPVCTEHLRRDHLLTDEFAVMPFVPFTRFVR